MRSSLSVYTRRLVGVGGCFAGGFTLLCLSGWAMVAHSRPEDTTLVSAMRWLPILVGVAIIGAGFYLLQAPVKQTPVDFFQNSEND